MAEDRTGPIVRFGIIGLGRAVTSMLPSLLAHSGVRVTAAAAPRAEPRERFASQFGAQAFASAEDLCRSTDVDAVYVATPHQFHAEHVLLAAAYGKHVIVEKPMALTLEDCDSMIAAVERAAVRLVVGPSHGFDPPVLQMREIIASGALGPLRMIHSWNYTDFLYRPRRPEELDTSLGGGIIFNQVPHQIDSVRWLGGGLVRSVRAMTGVWDPARPTEGAHSTFLEFEDGAVATVVYSGYDHFDSDELHGWVGEGGVPKQPNRQAQARAALRAVRSPAEEAAMKASTGFGGARQRHAGLTSPDQQRHHPHFGITIASCDRGDLRPSPNGIWIYGDDGPREIPVPLGRATPDKGRTVDELYAAVTADRPVYHDGRWGKATLEVCLAILDSARARKEIMLQHQVPAGSTEH
jgi:phthalate 4,5-cis-dihydrodiol dehydrogenase